MTAISKSARHSFSAEVIRIHERYLVEVVERFCFCPWAAAARQGRRTQSTVVFGQGPTPETVVEEVSRLFAAGRLEVGFVILPQFTSSRAEFEAFTDSVRSLLRGTELVAGPLAIAPFHPDASPDLESPSRLIPYLRRTPDPTLQLIPVSVLEAFTKEPSGHAAYIQPAMLGPSAPKKSGNSIRDQIPVDNHQRVIELGVEQLERSLQSIQDDRAQSYARYAQQRV